MILDAPDCSGADVRHPADLFVLRCQLAMALCSLTWVCRVFSELRVIAVTGRSSRLATISVLLRLGVTAEVPRRFHNKRLASGLEPALVACRLERSHDCVATDASPACEFLLREGRFELD
jgi:hypothetical protein